MAQKQLRVQHVLSFLSSMLVASATHALDTEVVLTADTEITASATELVTFGLPLAEGDVTSTDQIRVSIGGTEQPIYAEEGLRWHWSDNSLRSVTIQLQNVDMTAGDITLSITDAGRNTANDLAEQSHSNGWAQAGANKNNLPYPRIFALHDTVYLATTNIVPPYAPVLTSNNFTQYQSGQFDSWAGALNYSTSSGGNWLFDRSSAMYKAYLNATSKADQLKFLKEAFLSKQFYYTYVRNDGTPPAQSGGDGCWTYSGVACADGKYVQPQSAKLTLALTGDDSQWDDQLIINMATMSDLGWNQYGTRDPYDSEVEGFTERGAGMAGLAEVHAYEITGSNTLLTRMTERIASLKDMQQTEKPWDITNGWTPKSGGFTHSVAVHEGASNEGNAVLGNTNDRAFSAWMSENIADFLWQAYNITGNSNVPEMLRLLGNAIEQYGFTTNYSNGSYVRRSAFTGNNRTKACNSEGAATDILYFASAYASQDTNGIAKSDWWPYYSDTHAVEIVLPLALAYYFETDAAQKTVLQSRIERIKTGWLNASCQTVFDGVYRLWNWQHRSNSIATWQWIENGGELLDVEEVVSENPPLPPGSISVSIISNSSSSSDDDNSSDSSSSNLSGWAYVTNDPACSEGDSWHWQCGNGDTWVPVANIGSYAFVAICAVSDGTTCDNTANNRIWTAVSNLASTDLVNVCDTEPSNSDTRSSCGEAGGTNSFSSGASSGGSSNNSDDSSSDDSNSDSDDSNNDDSTSNGDDGGSDSGSGGGVSSTSGTHGLSFSNVSSVAIDSSPDIVQVFWAGMPDVNGDGCLDLYIGSHSDAVNSNMLIQDNVNGDCQGTFSYFADQNNYSQAAPITPRITSRYIFGNWYGHPEGFWSFYGADVDGDASARYVLDPSFTTVGGQPQYLPKSTGCFGARPKCLILDVDGDNNFEMASKLYASPYNTGYIVNLTTGATIYTPDQRANTFAESLVVFDVNNDGKPEVIHDIEGGYWSFNGSQMVWNANKISGTLASATGNHKLVLDYDSDGDMDLMVGAGIYNQAGTFNMRMYQNDGNGNFTDVTATAFGSFSMSNTPYHTTYGNSSVADINLDGYPDIIVGSETFSSIVILINNGNGTFTKDTSIDLLTLNYGVDSDRPWMNLADFDNDGLIDLVHNGRGSGAVQTGQLWRNTMATDNHWLRVRVRGSGANTDGLHSHIIAYEPGSSNVVTSYQIGVFSSGYQNLIPHLGLGDLETVDLEIRHPHSGSSCLYSNVAVDRDVISFPNCELESYTPGTKVPLTPSS